MSLVLKISISGFVPEQITIPKASEDLTGSTKKSDTSSNLWPITVSDPFSDPKAQTLKKIFGLIKQ